MTGLREDLEHRLYVATNKKAELLSYSEVTSMVLELLREECEKRAEAATFDKLKQISVGTHLTIEVASAVKLADLDAILKELTE